MPLGAGCRLLLGRQVTGSSAGTPLCCSVSGKVRVLRDTAWHGACGRVRQMHGGGGVAALE
jgi:hypothetical protein